MDLDLARALRSAGLRWHPEPGDAFTIDRPELEDEVFTVSDMAIEPHEFDTGTILGFNGTTEWALDSVALEDALWLPREDQLRERLGEVFRSLVSVRRGASYRVGVVVAGSERWFEAADAVTAYGAALLTLLGDPGSSGAEGRPRSSGA